MFNNRLKINGCVEKYYGEMVAFRSVTKVQLFYNILHHAASAIIRDFIFAKMRVTKIIPCPFLAKMVRYLLQLHFIVKK